MRLEKKGKQIASFEVMIHPAFNEDNVIIDQISKQELNTYIKQLKNYKNAVSYGT